MHPDQNPPEMTEAQKQLVVLVNLEKVLLGTKFIPEEFLAATEMIRFVDSLKQQAMQAAGVSPAPPQPEAAAPATA
jgi:hypothetical protein